MKFTLSSKSNARVEGEGNVGKGFKVFDLCFLFTSHQCYGNLQFLHSCNPYNCYICVLCNFKPKQYFSGH